MSTKIKRNKASLLLAVESFKQIGVDKKPAKLF
jgi:hypothetical protein